MKTTRKQSLPALALLGALAFTPTPVRAADLCACGFSAKKDLPAQLLARNQPVAPKIEKGEPVATPGYPGITPTPKD